MPIIVAEVCDLCGMGMYSRKFFGGWGEVEKFIREGVRGESICVECVLEEAQQKEDKPDD